MRDRTVYAMDHRAIDPATGRVRWIHSEGKATYDAEGNMLRFDGVNYDITERKQTEAALRENHRFVTEVTSVLPGVIYVFDLSTRHNVFVNRQTGVALGYSQAEIQAAGADFLARVLHPEDAPRMEEHFGRMAELADGAIAELEYRFRHRDGSWRWFLSRDIVYRRTPSGAAQQLLGIATDITNRKRAEEERVRLVEQLRSVNQRFELLLRKLPVAVTIAEDPECRRITTNAFGARLFETAEQENLSASAEPPPPHRYFHQGRRLQPGEMPMQLAISGGREVGEMEIECHLPSGRRWTALVTAAPFQDATGSVVRGLAVATDITARKEFEEELERQVAERTAKLQELVGELEHFSHTITHDMRAPLRAMRGYAEMILDERATGVFDKNALLRRIVGAAERMDLLITDALNYSKAVRQELPLGPVDLRALLQGMLDSYPEFQVDKARIEVARAIPSVLGNTAGLTQCFSNLLGNAVKFVHPGQLPEIRVWAEEVPATSHTSAAPSAGGGAINPDRLAPPCWVRIWVEDRGIGIPPSALPRVFNMFSRATHEYSGTGIGLALVRKVVDRMGGRVGAESELGKGSRFWVELQPGDPRRRPAVVHPLPPADAQSIL